MIAHDALRCSTRLALSSAPSIEEQKTHASSGRCSCFRYSIRHGDHKISINVSAGKLRPTLAGTSRPLRRPSTSRSNSLKSAACKHTWNCFCSTATDKSYRNQRPCAAERLLLLESIAAVTAAPKLRETPTGGAALRLLDVGAGGGIPGIPLAIAFPHLAVTLLEATRKKVDFLQHAIASLALENVTALWGRAEDLAHVPLHREQYDVVAVRGVGSLATVAELALPFCKRNGMLVAFKSLPLDSELQAASHAIDLLGGRDPCVTPFNLPELPAPHCVVTLTKSARTPRQYPRRDGKPAKRPLSQPSSAGISRTRRRS